ncbi:MAG: hypothetical protein V2B19_10640 [Pseudomonadota bacterium]
MKYSRMGTIGLALLFLSAALSARAEDTWRFQAFIDIETPGLVEAVVPPELLVQTGKGEMDFLLTGPDGLPRAFTLFWREPVGEITLSLKPDRVEFNEENALVWEAKLLEKITAERIRITLTEPGTIGKIDIHGQIGDEWRPLALNAAVFKTPGPRQAGIGIPENRYERLRIILTGYDRRVEKSLSPIETVSVEGKRVGRDYVTRDLPLPFQKSESEGTHVIEAVIPGDGLWINALTLKTEAPFQGDWQAGNETISGGKKRFGAILSGRSTQVTSQEPELVMETNRPWPGRSLVVKLDAGDRYIGDVTSLRATVRLPRLVFAAEKAGRFTATSGAGKAAGIGAHPSDGYREPETRIEFSVPETNPHWRLASLVEKYPLKGAPFTAEGYTWRASVTIDRPGYYRLPLNLRASLAPRCAAVRMVKDDLQVPYITGRMENKSIELENTATYDASTNTSTWIIHLPHPSPHWKEMSVYATGIFKREIDFQIPKPGARTWQSRRRAVWESRGQRETTLRLSLQNLPEDIDTLRLVMAHGDNEAVSISKITASYASPTFLFLAHAAGEFTVYGGNPEAGVPQYDLSLVQSELLSTLPVETQMGELESFSGQGWQHAIKDAFKGKGWGLYVVLGLVTLVLLAVIVRLFPKPEDTPPA